MPKYLGSGVGFFLVQCELIPNADEKKFHERVCNKCAYWKDAVERQKRATKEGRTWKKLVCIHPSNKAAYEKLATHITVWAKP